MRRVEDPKLCKQCKVAKPRDEFYRVKNTAQGVHTLCKPCHNEESKSHAKRNRVRCRVSVRKADLKRNYGLTIEGYDAIFLSQGSCCAICKRTEAGGKGRFHVDHCHDTGVVRGLLCHHCNVGLGYFKDNPELMEIGVRYLRESRHG